MYDDHETARRALLAEIGLLGPVRREMSRCVVPHLHEGGASVLWHLGKQGPQRLTALAAALQLDVSVVSRQVGDLVRAGYVDRRADERDRRAQLLSISPTGQAALDAAIDRVEARFRDALASWDTGEITHLADSLHRLRTALIPTALTPTAAGLQVPDEAA